MIRRRPLLSAILALLAGKLAMMVIASLSFVLLGAPGTIVGATGMLVLLGLIPLACVLLLRRHGWLDIAGFNPPSRWREPWLVLVPLLLVLLNLVNALKPGLVYHHNGAAMLSAAVQAISVPLVEETLFRGLIVALMLHRFGHTQAGVIRAVVVQALLFGLWHLPPNPIVPWQVSVSNVIYTVFIGIGFAATMLRTRSTWLVMGVHALVVFTNAGLAALLTGQAGRLAESNSPDTAWLAAIVPIVATIPLAIYGLWLLRDVSRLELDRRTGQEAGGGTASPTRSAQ